MALKGLVFRNVSWIRRREALARDALILAAFLAVGAVIALRFQLFGGEPGARTITLEEAMLFAASLFLGLAVLAGRRLSAQGTEIRRRVRAEREARTLALQDPLTGLANRRRFDAALAKAVDGPPGAGAAHALFLMDVNGFKRVNDVFGHGVGDELLCVVAQRLTNLVRAGDMVARLGGDEFAIVARHLTGPEAATSLGLRIVEAFQTPITVGNTEHAVGMGIGIALIPRDGVDGGELLRKADIALYRAKAEGPSALRFFEEDMDAAVRERDLIERELRIAIGTGAIRPYYQPLIDLQSGRVVGFEALARWMHPTMGEIEPRRFFPIAEDVGMVRELTGHLLRMACRDAREWPRDTTLCFNLSPVELRDRTLGLRLLSILAETGLPPRRLELEITESALVRDLDAAKDVVGTLREAGVRIALDDFGTGYSSLYHLRNFKFDKIKIDSSFVQAMAEEESAAIVRALLGLGRGLGLTVTAEGIESTSQAAFLRAEGCEQGQGFLYSEAISADDAKVLFQVPRAQRA